MPGRQLSKRQLARIRNIQERRRERLTERAERALAGNPTEQPRHGQVITRFGSRLVVEDEAGELFTCLSRQNLGDVVCGDRVVWQRSEQSAGVITAVMPRDSVLLRTDIRGREKPLAANITRIVIVFAPQPPPSELLIDQYLVAAENAGIRAILALNKTDLLRDDAVEAFDERFRLYSKIGYQLVRVSARREHGLSPLIDLLHGQTSVLVGQSGVGKSSLIKALLPHRDITIGRLSHTTGLGRHTTSATTCYHLPEGGDLIDSPGVRGFRPGRLRIDQILLGFPEFRPYLGRCKFSDCSHTHEPGCALLEALEQGRIDDRRLASLHRLAEEAQN